MRNCLSEVHSFAALSLYYSEAEHLPLDAASWMYAGASLCALRLWHGRNSSKQLTAAAQPGT
jgi:hypothetical protein